MSQSLVSLHTASVGFKILLLGIYTIISDATVVSSAAFHSDDEVFYGAYDGFFFDFAREP